jgi:hypothetical protein
MDPTPGWTSTSWPDVQVRRARNHVRRHHVVHERGNDVGRSSVLNNAAHTIVGVRPHLPTDFPTEAEVWRPLVVPAGRTRPNWLNPDRCWTVRRVRALLFLLLAAAIFALATACASTGGLLVRGSSSAGANSWCTLRWGRQPGG